MDSEETIDNYSERDVLQEESRKLEAFVEDWEDDDFSDEDEEQLMIDLEKASASTGDHASTYSSFAESGSLRTTSIVQDREEDREAGPSVPLDSDLTPGEPVVSAEKTLALNRALQGIVEGYIESVTTALKENRDQQKALEEQMSDDFNKKTLKGEKYGPFRSPFFRTDTSYPPPNEDVLQKQKTKEPVLDYLREHLKFKKKSKDLLKEAVLMDKREQILKPLYTRHDAETQKEIAIKNRMDEIDDEIDKEKQLLERLICKSEKLPTMGLNKEQYAEEKDEVLKSIRKLNAEYAEKDKELADHSEILQHYKDELREINAIPMKNMLKNIKSDEVDWMKISKQWFNANTTWVDCKKIWEHEVSPSLNLGKWKRAEEKDLKHLVEKYGKYGEWETIAKELATGRTAFACLSHYQTKHNEDLKSRNWTDAEDNELVAHVQNIQNCFSFISWKKVATLMEARSPVECMVRFTRIDPSQKHGRWTAKEDSRLISAVEMFGNNWAKVAKFIGSRNMFQCRDRYLNTLEPNLNHAFFTFDEDMKLMRFVKEFGHSWAKMVPHFNGRTDAMLLARYRTLQKWHEQTTWFNMQSKQIKDLMLGNLLPAKERKRLELRTEAIIARDMGIYMKDYARIEEEVKKGTDPAIIPPRPTFHLKLCKGYLKSGSQATTSWMRRLLMTQKILNNLRRRCAEYSEKRNQLDSKKYRLEGIKPQTKIESDIMNNLTDEVEELNSEEATSLIPKNNLIEMQTTLNRMFLGDSTINVQQLLDQSTLTKKTLPPEKNSITNILTQLKNIVRRRSLPFIRAGRARRFLPIDERPEEEIEAELNRLDRSIPIMLSKGLGTELQNLHRSIRMTILNKEEDFLTTKPDMYLEDPGYKEDIEELDQLEQEVKDKFEPELREKLYRIDFKRKKIQKAYESKYKDQQMQSLSDIKYHQDDKVYIEKVLGITDVTEADKTEINGEMDEKGDAENEHGEQMEEEDQKGPTRKRRRKVMPPRQKSHRSTKERCNERMTLINKHFARKPRVQRPKIDLEINKTLEEVIAEKSTFTVDKKSLYNKLPSFPPCVSTMAALRTLLLLKNSLQTKAESLIQSLEDKKSIHSTIHLISDDSVPLDDRNMAEKWLDRSNEGDISKQAKSFSGFRTRNEQSLNVPYMDMKIPPHIIAKHSKSEAVKILLEGEEEVERPGSLEAPRPPPFKPVKPTRPRWVQEINQLTIIEKNKKSEYEIVYGPASKNQPRFTNPSFEDKEFTYSARKWHRQDEGSSLEVVNVGLEKADQEKEETEENLDEDREKNRERIVSDLTEAKEEDIVKDEDEGKECDGEEHAVDERGDGLKDDGGSSIGESSVGLSYNDSDDDLMVDEERSNKIKSIMLTDGEKSRADQSRWVSKKPSRPVIRDNLSTSSSRKMRVRFAEDMTDKIGKCNTDSISKKYEGSLDRIVVAGLDPSGKKLVHYKPEASGFRAIEEVPIEKIEKATPLQPYYPTKEEAIERKMREGTYIEDVRESLEYKILFSRFKSLFLWPGLMSTVTPPRVQSIKIPEYSQPGEEVAEKKKKAYPTKRKYRKRRTHGRPVGRPSLIRLEAEKIAKDKKSRVKKLEVKRKTRKSRAMEVLDSIPIPAKRKSDDREIDGASKVKRGRLTKVESTRRKEEARKAYEKRALRRSSRQTKGQKEVSAYEQGLQEDDVPGFKIERDVEVHLQLPEWWKEAVLATMLAKKAMAEDGDSDEEVPIADDPDFQDRGGYSDDEWVQEYRAAEAATRENSKETTNLGEDEEI